VDTCRVQQVRCARDRRRPLSPYVTYERPPDPRHAVRALALQARTRELAIYTGAGISMWGPDPLPSGRDVGLAVARRVGPALGLTHQQIETVTLEGLGDLAEGHGASAVDLLRQASAKAARFEDVLPNDGHRAIALLLCESAAIGMTVNWDRGIENAAAQLPIDLGAVVQQQDLQRVPEPQLLKLHGCAREPATLRISSAEIKQPEPWARDHTRARLRDRTVVFIGLGTVGAYVSEGIEELLPLWEVDGSNVRVVDRDLRSDWANALGDHAADAFISLDAETFLKVLLDELLRDLVYRARDYALRLSEDDQRYGRAAEGADRLMALLSEHTALPLWVWCRAACGPGHHGKRYITDETAVPVMTGVLATIGDADVTIAGGVEDSRLVTPERFLELACTQGLTPTEVLRQQRERFRRTRGRYGDGSRPVRVFCSGHVGPLPPRAAAQDVTDVPLDARDISDGADSFDALELVDGSTWLEAA
jgi:hypothetical protein